MVTKYEPDVIPMIIGEYHHEVEIGIKWQYLQNHVAPDLFYAYRPQNTQKPYFNQLYPKFRICTP